MAYTFNPRTQEAEAAGILEFEAWSIEQGLHGETHPVSKDRSNKIGGVSVKCMARKYMSLSSSP